MQFIDEPAPKAFPARQGWRMPAEWEPHDCCWMAWPTRRRWKGSFDDVSRTLARIARAIARFEPVKIAAQPGDIAEAARMCGPGVNVFGVPLDDLWIRDAGPTFLLNQQGSLGGATWRFNAWGGKHRSYARDALLGGRLLAQLGLETFAAPLVCEGGAISVDGQGMLLTTESVLLNANRNPGLSKAEVEVQLCAFTGSRKIIWLPGSNADHVTDGHIDGIAVFAGLGVVIAELTNDPEDPEYAILSENLRALRLATDEKGRQLTVLTLLRPPYNPEWPDDFAATYVNFYIANRAVIVPAFGHPRADAAAVKTISAAFPTRQIVNLRIDAIAAGGGGIHCVTQQQPAWKEAADPRDSRSASFTRPPRKALK